MWWRCLRCVYFAQHLFRFIGISCAGFSHRFHADFLRRCYTDFSRSTCSDSSEQVLRKKLRALKAERAGRSGEAEWLAERTFRRGDHAGLAARSRVEGCWFFQKKWRDDGSSDEFFKRFRARRRSLGRRRCTWCRGRSGLGCAGAGGRRRARCARRSCRGGGRGRWRRRWG
jgi:hypothetical protein